MFAIYVGKIPSVTKLLMSVVRVMGVFRMAASELHSDLNSNLAPTEIYGTSIWIHRLTVTSNE